MKRAAKNPQSKFLERAFFVVQINTKEKTCEMIVMFPSTKHSLQVKTIHSYFRYPLESLHILQYNNSICKFFHEVQAQTYREAFQHFFVQPTLRTFM